MNKNQYLDLEALKSHFSGDEEMIGDLIEIFESSYEPILMEIKNSIDSSDYSKLEYSAHTFKGMVSNFFAKEIKDAAFELEKLGRNSSLIEASHYFEIVNSGTPLLLAELKASFNL